MGGAAALQPLMLHLKTPAATLKRLILWDNRMGNAGAIALAQALACSLTLEEVALASTTSQWVVPELWLRPWSATQLCASLGYGTTHCKTPVSCPLLQLFASTARCANWIWKRLACPTLVWKAWLVPCGPTTACVAFASATTTLVIVGCAPWPNPWFSTSNYKLWTCRSCTMPRNMP